ncbi:response regulator transcription factor [uncultured Pseudodesulfovibrio sp.]|uniref:response regulator transcription factor n=1 Tax=uncultured Pseudodesulfovibrio sp. TaxID=2035858 RepID=UPI0029C72F72|nr:response regulator transcription factor [uncultured Pseudodesulfovibrio sp.]
MTNNASALNFILIDDHPAIRKGLGILLGTRGHSVLYEAAGKAEAQAILKVREFDVALLDLTLQDGSGLDLLPDLEGLNIAALVYSMHEDAELLHRAFRCGALGYVSKQEDADVLFEAIDSIVAGKRYISPRVAQCLEEDRGEERLEDSLSDREMEIFTLMGKGFGNTEIADQLGLSRRTVETYCNRMVRKFDFDGRKELRKFAISAL